MDSVVDVSKQADMERDMGILRLASSVARPLFQGSRCVLVVQIVSYSL